MQLENRVAIVTGAASGIGRATARLFAEQGARVIVADWNEAKGAEAAAEIQGRGQEASFCPADVSNEQDVKAMVKTAVERFGRLDILVNNAAVQILCTLVETTEEQWDRIQNVNLKGVFFGCKHAIPAMIHSGGGVVVNISSALGLVGDPGLAAYGAAKGGILALTKAAAIGYGPQGVRVNCICPGDVNTALVQEYFDKAENPEEFRREVYSKYALRRIAEPREVAQVAAFLASSASSFMTGSVVVVDGGLTSKCY